MDDHETIGRIEEPELTTPAGKEGECASESGAQNPLSAMYPEFGLALRLY